MEQYPTNLIDILWQVIEKIVCPQERKRKYSLRNIMNAILYLLKTGCQWPMIHKDFAPWESVYYYFSKWKKEGIIEELLDTLRSMLRVKLGLDESPARESLIHEASGLHIMWTLSEELTGTRRLRAENSRQLSILRDF